MIEILWYPFLACLILTGIHCYLGIHVLMREVIFVDLALAQIAALGTAVGVLAGCPVESPGAYAWSLGFTVLGAGVFAVSRFRDHRVPQEAIIGLVYAVAAAVAILIFSKSAVEREQIENMLMGRLLFAEPGEILRTALIYAAVGALHILFHRRFFAISRSAPAAFQAGLHVRAWDFLFYTTFGLVVTSSVQIAGVLLVFSFLVAPAVCAVMFFDSVAARLLTGWALGMVATLGGLAASIAWDLPPAVSIVAALGALVLLSALLHAARRAANPAREADR